MDHVSAVAPTASVGSTTVVPVSHPSPRRVACPTWIPTTSPMLLVGPTFAMSILRFQNGTSRLSTTAWELTHSGQGMDVV